MNAITVSRVRAKSRKEIVELGSHELFKNALTEKALAQYTNEDIVVKSWAMLHEESPAMDTKYIRSLMRDVKITEDDKIQLGMCFDRVIETYKTILNEDKKIAKRVITRTHMISIMRVAWRSIEEDKTVEQFSKWFMSFFNGKRSATNNATYNTAAGTGSGKAASVKKRLEELEKSYNDFFTK